MKQEPARDLEASPGGRASVQITKAVVEAIKRHGREAYPDEGCGFLLRPDATPRRIDEFRAATNIETEDRGEAVVLLDVREEDEWAINRIQGATLIPLATLPQRARELDPAAEIVAYCKMGSRSEQAVYYLRRLGFPKAKNLEGGIDAWIQ